MIFNHDLETVGKLVESWCTMRTVIHHAAGRKDGRRRTGSSREVLSKRAGVHLMLRLEIGDFCVLPEKLTIGWPPCNIHRMKRGEA